MRILVACERSQVVTSAFRAAGHEAYSCDTQACDEGVRQEWHIQGDAIDVAYTKGPWDMMIAHPPCTYLAKSGVRWLYHPDDKLLPQDQRRPHPKFPDRLQQREEAIDFVDRLFAAPVERIAIENPGGSLTTRWKKPTQRIQPWMFGHNAQKETLLWLKNLPPLKPTNVVDKGDFVTITHRKTGRKRRIPVWYSAAANDPERQYKRSVTFTGIAEAMVSQCTTTG